MKTPEELAPFAGINVPSYHDLEDADDELLTVISMGELSRICQLLGIKASSLFTDSQPGAEGEMSPPELIEMTRKRLQQTGTSLERLQNKVGYDLRDAFEAPEAVANWNIDCLRNLCEAVGANWLGALDGLAKPPTAGSSV